MTKEEKLKKWKEGVKKSWGSSGKREQERETDLTLPMVKNDNNE